MAKSSLKWNSLCGVLRHDPCVIQIEFGANSPERSRLLDSESLTPVIIIFYVAYFRSLTNKFIPSSPCRNINQ